MRDVRVLPSNPPVTSKCTTVTSSPAWSLAATVSPFSMEHPGPGEQGPEDLSWWLCDLFQMGAGLIGQSRATSCSEVGPGSLPIWMELCQILPILLLQICSCCLSHAAWHPRTKGRVIPGNSNSTPNSRGGCYFLEPWLLQATHSHVPHTTSSPGSVALHSSAGSTTIICEITKLFVSYVAWHHKFYLRHPAVFWSLL